MHEPDRLNFRVMSWQAAVERTVIGLGFELVDLERATGGLLRVTIDRVPGQPYASGPGEAVTVDDCEDVSRQLHYLLEVEQIDYARLEVSSPGLDRPLKKPADWQRFAGAQIELTLREPFQNRRHWRGTLMAGGSGSSWRLVLPRDSAPSKRSQRSRVRAAALEQPGAEPDRTLDFALDEVREARLVPVIDFKRRRAAARGTDGGQDSEQQP